jgi:hypothetical protein
MHSVPDVIQDVMQVCRKGHVITDRLHTDPDSRRTHCEVCGATTLERCLTCGQELPGALAVPGLRPVGTRQPPLYCVTCGAPFPWTARRRPAGGPEPLVRLETLLRRLPVVIRELRVRHDNRPAFRVVGVKDLEDLVRALLPIHFDDIRPESRTPSYSAGTRTDFLLAPEQIALTVKCAGPQLRGPELAEQLEEDVAYYQNSRTCPTLVCFIYDPEGLLHHFATPAVAGPQPDGDVSVRWIVAAP